MITGNSRRNCCCAARTSARPPGRSPRSRRRSASRRPIISRPSRCSAASAGAANSLDGSPDTRSLVAGPALTWNMFDYGRIRNNVRLQDARLQQSIEAVPEQRAAGGAGNRRRRDQRGEDRRAATDPRAVRCRPRSARSSLRIRSTRKATRTSSACWTRSARLFAQAERELLNHSAHISAVIALVQVDRRRLDRHADGADDSRIHA